jgi:hypothetical protein
MALFRGIGHLKTNHISYKLFALLIILLLSMPDVALMKFANAQSSTSQATQIYQPSFANAEWNYNSNKAKTTDQLNSADGSVLIYVHGICDDSIRSADSARDMATLGGLNSFMSFEYRDYPYEDSKSAAILGGLLGRFDNSQTQNDAWDSTYASSYAKELLETIVTTYEKTGQPPAVVTHSRGGMILTKAAVLWEGLCQLANEQSADSNSWSIKMSDDFMYMWNSLSQQDKNELFSQRKTMANIHIKVVTLEPDVSPNFSGWKALLNFAKEDLLNIYSSKDKAVLTANLFRGLINNGEIPNIRNQNIPLDIDWGHVGYANQEIIKTAVGEFIKQGYLSKEIVASIKLLIDNLNSPSNTPNVPSSSVESNGPPGPSSSPPTPLNPTDSLGGVNFTSISLRYILITNNSLAYVIKAQQTSDSNQQLTLEDNSELSFTSFLTGLVLPQSDFWVNLNPWEPDRIIESDLALTDSGRVMLEADIAMKRSFSSYENPGNGEIGSTFWDLLDQKQTDLVNTIMKNHPSEINDLNDIQFSPVTRHWIIPDKIEAYENNGGLYIADATLTVNSEPVSDQSTYTITNAPSLSASTKAGLDAAAKEYGKFVKETEDKMIVPLVAQDINQKQEYSDLRQIYSSLALAQWCKNKSSDSSLSDITDSRNLDGLRSEPEWSSLIIYNEYTKSFEEGEYHYWKNSTYQQGDSIITESKLYVGGGVDFSNIEITNLGNIPQNLQGTLIEALSSSYTKNENNHYFGQVLTFNGVATNPQQGNNQDQGTQPNQDTSETTTITVIAGAAIAISVVLVAYYAKQKRHDTKTQTKTTKNQWTNQIHQEITISCITKK